MIHLHTRSFYSLLESTLSVSRIVELAKENGQKAVVLSDHLSMYGTMEFLHEAKKASLKPVVGLEFEVVKDGQTFSLLALAKTTQGLQNLYRLSTRLMSEKTPLPLEELSGFGRDLIVMNAGGDDHLETLAHEGRLDGLSDFFLELQQQASGVFVALSIQDSPRYASSNAVLRSVADLLGLECTALSRIEYERPEDEKTLRLLQAISKGKRIQDPEIQVRKGRFWRTAAQMEALYDLQDLECTEKICEMVEDYALPKARVPRFPVRSHAPSEVFLRNLCQAGLKKRLGPRADFRYSERLEHELETILSMGFADYFLIVWDFIREARSRGILVGPGRGSAAGSLVAWCLGITHIDPVACGLLFERFLNPARISMPDIDTDFPDNRRDEIISYVQSRYGKGHAAHIVTFARMKARLALRDTARALNIPARDAEKLTRLIPSGSSMTLEEACKNLRAFASLVDNTPALNELYQAARRIEGFPRHASIHAGGIVLADDPIVSQAPLQEMNEALPVVQFPMDYLEELGLIKFDFLALRNLTVIDEIHQAVLEQTGQNIDLFRLPLNDPAVYKLLCQGDTLGIFQLESAGIRSLIVRYKPRRFEDIAAILALYRPGPMKNIDLFLNTRFHPGRRRSLHPLLDGLLAETGGVFVYQEQIMEAARLIGGFSLQQADVLRKAMSKKNRAVMEQWKQKFLEGAKEKGVEASQAETIFSIMEQFADYGFNKSHSYAYGLVVYQMAWLKARFPLQFYQCLLNSSIGSGTRTRQFLQECTLRNIRVEPLSLNRSALRFEVMEGALRLPLTLIRGMSRQSVEKIMQERQEHGPFLDPALSILRLLNLKLSQNQILSLIRTGAFEEQGLSRESLEEAFEEICRLADLVQVDPQSGQWRFSGVTPPQIDVKPLKRMERLSHEKELLGFYLSRHPAELVRRKNPRLISLRQASGRQGPLETAGIVHSIRFQKTKKGEPMAFATLSDETGDLDLALMPWVYQKAAPFLKENTLVSLEATKNRPHSMLVNRMEPLNSEALFKPDPS